MFCKNLKAVRGEKEETMRKVVESKKSNERKSQSKGETSKRRRELRETEGIVTFCKKKKMNGWSERSEK